jgi:Na+/H+ antiporter NhaC
MSRQEYIDKYLSKFISRKLIVFLIASIGLFTNNITGDNWVVISTAYISVEGFTKIVTEVYKSRQ